MRYVCRLFSSLPFSAFYVPFFPRHCRSAVVFALLISMSSALSVFSALCRCQSFPASPAVRLPSPLPPAPAHVFNNNTRSWGVHTVSVSGEAGLKVALAKDKASASAVDPASKYGETVLMLAAEKGMVEKVKELLAAGAKVDAVDKRGRTALHAAVFSGNKDVVKLLLDAKCPAPKDKDKISPAAMARAKGYADCAALLK